MNSLLSGLAESQKNGGNKNNNCNNNGNCGGGGGFGGGGSIIWIIVLLLIFCGQGQGQDCGTVCGCEKKHCKELCRCGGSTNNGIFGLGGLGGGCGGLGGGSGIWLILLLIVFACGGNQKKGCTNNIINLDNCDEE
ncbi:MAG: hypothetical protein ACI8WT_000687 [Clostridium sp.]|jgi:hypothetical protein